MSSGFLVNLDFEVGQVEKHRVSFHYNQFWGNLSIAVARSEDTLDTLKEKVQAAAVIGTIQSLATYFPDLRPIWKQNCSEERLLGVDITGQMDSPATHDPEVMRALREVA